jgi:type IV secretory pathway protease TraF
VVIPIALFAWWAMPKLSIVMTPSIDAWVVTPSPGSIVKGDYVQFMLSHPIAGPKPVSVTKHALCMPGDRLTMQERPSAGSAGAWDGYYFCNGQLLGVSLPVGRHGQRLEHLRWSGTIPADFAYVGSHHPRGFDSRYFGLVPLKRLTRMRRLL